MFNVVSNPSRDIVSAATPSGTGSALDARNAGLQYVTYGVYGASPASALYTLQASHDLSIWTTIATFTAVTTPAIYTGNNYFPYVRATVNSIFSGTNQTGSGFLNYSTLA